MNQADRIRNFSEIPDILTMEVPQMEYIVPALGIARNTITLWTGADGHGKTYLAQAMTAAIANGTEFLGMICHRTPVLYLDLENPAYTVQGRMQNIAGDAPNANLKVWGIWNEQQPPQSGTDLLLTIARDTQPVIVIDPFRYWHSAEENDSTAMSGVMQYCRALARYGCAVILLHHPSKTEGSTGRGSSAIRGACDLAFIHSLDKDSGLITLKVDKNRNGESRTITIRADFEEGGFTVADSPYIARRNDEMERLEQIIKITPGMSQNDVIKESNMTRKRCIALLGEGCGTRWHSKKGPRNAKLYYPGSISEALVPQPSLEITDEDVPF